MGRRGQRPRRVTVWRDREMLGERPADEWMKYFGKGKAWVHAHAHQKKPYESNGHTYWFAHTGIEMPNGMIVPIANVSLPWDKETMHNPLKKKKLSEINALARAAGMHYGDYVALMEGKKRYEKDTDC